MRKTFALAATLTAACQGVEPMPEDLSAMEAAFGSWSTDACPAALSPTEQAECEQAITEALDSQRELIELRTSAVQEVIVSTPVAQGKTPDIFVGTQELPLWGVDRRLTLTGNVSKWTHSCRPINTDPTVEHCTVEATIPALTKEEDPAVIQWTVTHDQDGIRAWSQNIVIHGEERERATPLHLGQWENPTDAWVVDMTGAYLTEQGSLDEKVEAGKEGANVILQLIGQ